jgi:hypothetical protein
VSTTEELLDRKVAAHIQKTDTTAVGIRHADDVAPSIRKFGITSPTSGGRSVGVVRSRTQTMEFSFVSCLIFDPFSFRSDAQFDSRHLLTLTPTNFPLRCVGYGLYS